MSDISISKHGNDRLQQRAIPPFVLDLLLNFGQTQHDHQGCELVYFGKSGLRRVSRHLGPQIAGHLGHYRSAYAIVAGGRIVTAGYRTKRISRT